MNVYQIITARILDALRNGVVPWKSPWTVEAPRNLVSGKEYRGVNVLLLQSTAFSSPYWVTFNQARNLGGIVKRGARGTPVIFWKVSEKDDADRESKRSFILRYYTVFNVAQTEGLRIPEPADPRVFDLIEECEKVVAAYRNPPKIEHGGGRAGYFPALDRVRLPERACFDSAASYYATLFHELAHSTGAEHRLNRPGVVDPIRFGSHDYAFEELVAECGAAFLGARTGISADILPSSAAYIASWAQKLKSEPRWIVDAAAQAAKASDLILGKQAGVVADKEAIDEAA